MNVPMRDWKDLLFVLLSIITAPAGVEFLDLLKCKITRKEFLKKLRKEKMFLFSFICLIFFLIFAPVYFLSS